MSIASELSALNGYILGAYDEINDKGGTVPANKNMANLASAISSISTGTPTTITPLEVTENGTYTAPTGIAYSPVTVNVSGGGGVDISAFRGCTKIEVGVYQPTSMNPNTIPHSLGLVPKLFALYETTLSMGGRNSLIQDLAVQTSTYQGGDIIGGLCYNRMDMLNMIAVPSGMVSFSSTGVTISSTTYKMDTSVSYMYIVIG